MRIDLIRSFSTAKNGDDESEDWLRYLRKGKGQYYWPDLLEHRVVVVLGEAGIGKTFEFENEVDRLQRGGKAAFFISLNQVLDNESWERVLADYSASYENWKNSIDPGFFFLDAVDEARLVSHAAFERALAVIKANLRPSLLSRVRVIISSRITDWDVESVRESVHKHLVAPIESVSRAANVGEEEGVTPTTTPFTHEVSSQPVKAFVVSMDALSQEEARKLAEALHLQSPEEFWSAVEDGDYEFMVTRPLDLEWMVQLWNDKRSLGTYLQLIDGNVANRLKDSNPSYQQAGAALSLDMLRDGAEHLAAAAEFSGRPFVSTTGNAVPNELAPFPILSDWNPVDISRLLASGVFDEATFGRVRFHHRRIREYLAASWLDRQLRQGLPVHRIFPLFSTSPFGTPNLIPSRRAALSWLAALNVSVREWVTQNFPEILFFDGDPEAWDAISANTALTGYVERVKEGLWTDWWNDASEFRRIARRLPHGRIASLLSEQTPGSRVIRALLPLVSHGRLSDCADVVFGIYQCTETSLHERRYALNALATVASPEHRASIKDDLLAGRLQSSELISTAFAVADWARFSVEELAHVFKSAPAEPSYGSGSMARIFEDAILPKADTSSALNLLSAVIAVLPQPTPGKRFKRYPVSEQPDKAWLFDALPECLERLLSLLPKDLESFPEVCLEAAAQVEAIRNSGFTDRDDLSRLEAMVAERPALRWPLALLIAQSEEIRYAINRLIWRHGGCLVCFSTKDLPELIARANNLETSQEESDIWFSVGMQLALRELKGRIRTSVLTELCSSRDKDSREQHIRSLRADFISGVRQSRQFKLEDRLRKRERRLAFERKREAFTRCIEHIRNGSNDQILHSLISYSYNHSGRNSFTRVDFNVIAHDFGNSLADALASGLTIAWLKNAVPNPADFPNGEIPWKAITGVAGLHVLLERGTDFSLLNEEDAKRAAQLAVWEMNVPPSWFEQLFTTHETAVLSALHPWLDADAICSSEGPNYRRTLELSLRCPSTIRTKLLQPLVGFVEKSQIGSSETHKTILDAMYKDGLIEPGKVARLCKERIEATLDPEGLISDIGWFQKWFEADLISAWAWFETHVAGLGALVGKQVQAVVGTVFHQEGLRNLPSEENVAVLVRMHELLSAHASAPVSPPATEERQAFKQNITELKSSIIGILVQIRGGAANRALVNLVANEPDTARKQWLNARVTEHASHEAQHLACIEPEVLKTLGEPYLTEPKSERDLFQQAVGRLEEICKHLQEGPFSDRVLFPAGIPEKHLQLWLAARFVDTNNRRFSVHREEVVDADNRTDVQLSCQHGNVCVEIKPLDRSRSYSATSLVDTLRFQIVGQYLKGLNSAHGILVLFRLDNKAWDIPGGGRTKEFEQLVQYLQRQADMVKAESPSVRELLVVGVDCVG